MTLSADLVEVAATGAVYMSTVGAAAPANGTTAWGTVWGDLGYMNEDGVTETPSLDTEEIKAWQSGAVVRKVITGSRLEFNFTGIETNLRTLELFYPGSTIATVGSDTKVTIKLPVAVPKAFGIDAIDGTDTIRIIIPKAQITERGEVTYVNGAPIAYPFTIAVEPDSAGVLAVKYVNPVVT
jgi:hypothetical protein